MNDEIYSYLFSLCIKYNAQFKCHKVLFAMFVLKDFVIYRDYLIS